MTGRVEYTGDEIALLAGILAGALPTLDDEDFDVADLLLEKALAALPWPMPPVLAAKIEHQRQTPPERFWSRLRKEIQIGKNFTIVEAGCAGQVTPSRALILLSALWGRKPGLVRVGDHHWSMTV